MASRIVLELVHHPQTAFYTLTYSPEELPFTRLGNQTLSVKDTELFLRRSRKVVREFYPWRYVHVGEHGTRTGRVHYHGLFFGVSAQWLEGEMDKLWPKGHWKVDYADARSADYLCKELVKQFDDFDGLQEERSGTDTELVTRLARRSQKPFIGKVGLDAMVEMYGSRSGRLVLEEEGDVRDVFRHEGKTYPLDPFSLRYLRKAVGISARADYRRARRMLNKPGYFERAVNAEEKGRRRFRYGQF